MMIFRLIGSAFLLIAVVALVSDVTRMQIAKRGLIVTPLASHWAENAPQSFDATKAGVQKVHPALWQPLLTKALQTPTSVAFGLAGVLVCWLGRQRRRVNVYAN